MADAILRELRRNEGGLTRNEIRELFKRNRSEAEISRALSFLLEGGWVRSAPENGWTAVRALVCCGGRGYAINAMSSPDTVGAAHLWRLPRARALGKQWAANL